LCPRDLSPGEPTYDKDSHVHLADSNRVQPGAGHTDFARAFEALRSVGFEGYMAMECGIRGDAREVLPEVVRHLRSMM
ncbi:MAG TPA: TIM barrel protein, partial [Rubrobacteraceae bacterium]